jgi:hypothetical protein
MNGILQAVHIAYAEYPAALREVNPIVFHRYRRIAEGGGDSAS